MDSHVGASTEMPSSRRLRMVRNSSSPGTRTSSTPCTGGDDFMYATVSSIKSRTRQRCARFTAMSKPRLVASVGAIDAFKRCVPACFGHAHPRSLGGTPELAQVDVTDATNTSSTSRHWESRNELRIRLEVETTLAKTLFLGHFNTVLCWIFHSFRPFATHSMQARFGNYRVVSPAAELAVPSRQWLDRRTGQSRGVCPRSGKSA
jgi:hypothetical protein